MQWRFYLIDRTGKRIAAEEPQGWSDLSITLARHPERHGTFAEVQSVRLTFYGSAALLINREFRSYGVRADIKLEIDNYCNASWLPWYRGQLNFENYESTSGELCSASVDVDPVGAYVKFVNRFDQQVDIGKTTSFEGVPLDDYTHLKKNIELPGKAIRITTQGSMSEALTSEDFTNSPDWGVNVPDLLADIMNAHIIPGFNGTNVSDIPDSSVRVGHGFLAGNLSGHNTGPGRVGAVPFIEVKALGAIPCVATNGVLRYRLKGSLKITQGGQTDGSYQSWFTVIRLPGGFDPNKWWNYDQVVDRWIASGPYSDNPRYFDISDTVPITLEEGDKIWVAIFLRCNPNRAAACYYTQDAESFITVEMDSICEPTRANVYMINETLSRATEAITDGELKVYSEYYGRTDSAPFSHNANGCGAFRALTTGLDIRNVKKKDGTDPALFVSMEELFNNLRTIDNIGMGMMGDDVIRIEPYKFFYKPGVIFSCENVNNITLKVQSDEIYSLFKFGYDKWEAEEYNGLDEFLTQREYRTNISQVKNTLERLCSFIASGYAIEITRRQYESSKDWRYDEEKFIICLKQGYIVNTGNVQNAEHIVSPETLYNFEISPARIALRWFGTVMAGLREITPADKLMFNSAEANYKAKGTLISDCKLEQGALAEDQDFSLADFADPEDGLHIKHTERVSFTYPLTAQEFRRISRDPDGLIRYSDGKQSGEGWIDRLVYRPNDGQAQFTLIPKSDYHA